MSKAATTLPVFSRNLMTLRTKAALDRPDVCPHVGLSESSLRYLETGKRNYSAKSLAALADFYGVTTADVLADKDPPEPRVKVKRGNVAFSLQILVPDVGKALRADAERAIADLNARYQRGRS